MVSKSKLGSKLAFTGKKVRRCPVTGTSRLSESLKRARRSRTSHPCGWVSPAGIRLQPRVPRSWAATVPGAVLWTISCEPSRRSSISLWKRLHRPGSHAQPGPAPDARRHKAIGFWLSYQPAARYPPQINNESDQRHEQHGSIDLKREFRIQAVCTAAGDCRGVCNRSACIIRTCGARYDIQGNVQCIGGNRPRVQLLHRRR